MDLPGLPKEDGNEDQPLDPLLGAERALEEHEGDLVRKAIALAQRGIPEDATVKEAMAEMHRAMAQDPEIRELMESLMAMTLFGGGKAVRDWGKWQRENPPAYDSGCV
jgi:hypothetical protein